MASKPATNRLIDVLGRRALVFWDLETTGLDTKHDRVVQMGAVAAGAAGERFLQLVDPRRPMPAKAQATHGIGDDKLRGQPCFQDAWVRFAAFVARAATSVSDAEGVVLVGHNSSQYDDVLLLAELQRSNQSLAELDHRPMGVLSADTLVAARAARKAGRLPEKLSLTLESLHRHLFQEELVGAHDALADAVAVARICVHPTLAPFVSPQLFEEEAERKLNKRRLGAAAKKRPPSPQAPPLPKRKSREEGEAKVACVAAQETKRRRRSAPSSIWNCSGCRRTLSRFFEHKCPHATSSSSNQTSS